MVKIKSEAQEKIINATTELIKEHGDINKITVRDIATKSEVGVGLINYHFQTKENLINLCILRIISQFIEEIEGLYQSLEMSPIDKLKYVFKAKCAFIVANPGMSKISMLLDLTTGQLGDNTDQAAQVHLKALKEEFGDRRTDSELLVILHTIMSAVQVAFLRSNVFKIRTGIDFFDLAQRDKFIERTIDNVIS